MVGWLKIAGGMGKGFLFLWSIMGIEGIYSGDEWWKARVSVSMMLSCLMRVGV
jgi:hypothetical protein